MPDATRDESAPDTKLGRLGAIMLSHFEEVQPPGVRVVIMLDDPDDGQSMTVLGGYDDDHEAIARMFLHLAAIFQANGQQLKLVPLGRG